MKHPIVSRLTFVAVSLVAAAEVHARSYLLVANGNKLPANLASAVTAAGGSITRSLPQIGIAIVEAPDARFAAQARSIAGIGSVLTDAQWKTAEPWFGPSEIVVDSAATPSAGPVVVADNRFVLQWALTAVNAPGAWALGQQGAGVRIAVLDSGIANTHIDLAANVNTVLSTSFVPGEAYNFTGTGFNHGTHVAGIIASALNGIGTVGVAPSAQLVAVKVLSAVTGSGSFGAIISGIVYAADIQSDIINMSLGAEFPRSGFLDDNGTPTEPSDDVWVGANEVSALVTVLGRATSYAYQNGTTIIAAAGNDAIDRDHDANLWIVPGDLPHVINVSATGPIGWARNTTATFLDNLASYSNYGQSRISFAGPGGDYIYPGTENSTVGGVTRPTWVFDMVFSPSNRIGTGHVYSWAAGTSMAAPHVSGVAALIIGKNGGSMHPAKVEAALRASADDLGKRGNDDAYGAGRVNAARAVQ